MRYTHDLTDVEWAEVEALIPPAKPGGNKRTVNIREIVNGLMHILDPAANGATSRKTSRRAARYMTISIAPEVSIMDEFDHPFGPTGEDAGAFTILSYVLAFTLCLATCLLSFSQMSEAGPGVGEIIAFNPAEGPKRWEQPGIVAHLSSGRDCALMPSVISETGGSFVIEAKEMRSPPVFLVHWSGRRTDAGARDCGRSASLTLQLPQLRALANVAGGFGVEHRFFQRQ